MSTRHLIIQAEIDLVSCANSFGQSPCTATGEPCYNYYNQCKDRANFANGLSVLKLCTANQAHLPQNAGCLPLIQGKITPTGSKAQAGASLGVRGSVTLQLLDMPHNDIGLDPYRGQRAIPAKGGVFARLMARYQYLLNRPLRLVFLWTDSEGNQKREERHYLLDKIAKNAQGYSLTGIDPLKRLMDKQLTLPRVKLTNTIPKNRGSVTVNLDDASGFNSAGGYVRIGDEIFSYTGISGNSLSGVLETNKGSREPSEHKAGDPVIDCAYWTNTNPLDILAELFEMADARQYLDMFVLNSQRDKWLSNYRFTAIIPDDTSIVSLLNEIVQQTVVTAVFDERTQQVSVRVVAPPRRAPSLLFTTGEHGNARALTFRDTLANYASTVRIYYAMRDAVKGGNESANFDELAISADGDVAGELGFDTSRDLVQHSRWYPGEQTPQVKAVANLILKRRRAGVRKVSFITSLELSEGIELATHIVLTDIDMVDSKGYPQSYLLYVDAITPISAAEARIEGTTSPYPAAQRWFRLSANGVRRKYQDATPEERIKWGFLASPGGYMSDGTPGYALSGR